MRIIIFITLLFFGCNTVSYDVGPLMSQWVVHYDNSSDTIFAEVYSVENWPDGAKTIRFFTDDRVVCYFNFDAMGESVEIEHVKSYKCKT